VLPSAARSGKTSRSQVRFTSLFTWPHAYQCPSPVRWRWGRRWKSLDTALRKVWLASDLPRQSRDPTQLGLIQTPIPELGIAPKTAAAAAADTATTTSVALTKRAARHGCSVSRIDLPSKSPVLFLVALLAYLARSHRWLLARLRPLRDPANDMRRLLGSGTSAPKD
jgi:hypothetical protein